MRGNSRQQPEPEVLTALGVLGKGNESTSACVASTRSSGAASGRRYDGNVNMNSFPAIIQEMYVGVPVVVVHFVMLLQVYDLSSDFAHTAREEISLAIMTRVNAAADVAHQSMPAVYVAST